MNCQGVGVIINSINLIYCVLEKRLTTEHTNLSNDSVASSTVTGNVYC